LQKSLTEKTSSNKTTEPTTKPATIQYDTSKPPQLETPPTLIQTPKTTTPPKPQTQYKPLPPELKIILEALEEFEGIAYAARNKIYQLYGPVNYQIQNSTKQRTIDDIRMSFPEEIEINLDFIEQDNKFIIKIRKMLPADIFTKIASTVKGMGGKYVSAGKDSRFEVGKI
jgi:hypothetical protein